jgi:hypothetical protein
MLMNEKKKTIISFEKLALSQRTEDLLSYSSFLGIRDTFKSLSDCLRLPY